MAMVANLVDCLWLYYITAIVIEQYMIGVLPKNPAFLLRVGYFRWVVISQYTQNNEVS